MGGWARVMCELGPAWPTYLFGGLVKPSRQQQLLLKPAFSCKVESALPLSSGR
jgi:hypothetical protein